MPNDTCATWPARPEQCPAEPCLPRMSSTPTDSTPLARLMNCSTSGSPSVSRAMHWATEGSLAEHPTCARYVGYSRGHMPTLILLGSSQGLWNTQLILSPAVGALVQMAASEVHGGLPPFRALLDLSVLDQTYSTAMPPTLDVNPVSIRTSSTWATVWRRGFHSGTTQALARFCTTLGSRLSVTRSLLLLLVTVTEMGPISSPRLLAAQRNACARRPRPTRLRMNLPTCSQYVDCLRDFMPMLSMVAAVGILKCGIELVACRRRDRLGGDERGSQVPAILYVRTLLDGCPLPGTTHRD